MFAGVRFVTGLAERLVAALAVFCMAAADLAIALCAARKGRMGALRHLAGLRFMSCDGDDFIVPDVHRSLHHRV